MSHHFEEDTSIGFTRVTKETSTGYCFISSPLQTGTTCSKVQMFPGYAITTPVPGHVSQEDRCGLWNTGYDFGSRMRTNAMENVYHTNGGHYLEDDIIPDNTSWKTASLNAKELGGLTTAFFAGVLQGVHPPYDMRCQDLEDTKKATVDFLKFDLQDGTTNCISSFVIKVRMIPTKRFLEEVCQQAKVSVPKDFPKVTLHVSCNLRFMQHVQTGNRVALLRIGSQMYHSKV